MALTLAKENRLERAGLIKLFNDHQDVWHKLAKNAYKYVQKDFPPGSVIRCDDVCQVLAPLIEVHNLFVKAVSVNKLPEKYWIEYFCELILDRCWPPN